MTPPSEVADRVYRLGSRYINWYLVEDGGRLLVLDTGLPGYREQLPVALAALGRSMADIDAVVLTHYHVDHTGGAKRIADETGCAVRIHEADASHLRGEARRHRPRLPLTRRWFLGYLAHLLRNGAGGYPRVADPTTFADGETLDVPGRPRVIHLPGHTPGACALHLPEREVLLSGDALGTLDTARGTEGPTIMNRVWNTDSAAALACLDHLDGIFARTLLPGHGEPWKGGVAEAVRIARKKGIPS